MSAPAPTAPASRPAWLPATAYPFTLRSLDLGGQSVTYVDEGDGPVLLLVHTGMWSFVFRDVITRLRGDFRCVTLDLPGYGLSPDPAGQDPGLAEQSALLGAFVAALGLRDMTLVLHDLGGPVGLGLAADRPELVRGLVLANTFAWRPDRPALRTMLRLVSSRPVTELDALTRLVPLLSSTPAGAGRHLDRTGRRAFRGPFRSRRRVRRFHRLLGDALAADALYARIEAATAGALADRPVLTVFGERNDPFGFQARHHATFADHEGVVVRRGNHFPMLDDPDLFASSLRDWWRRRVADRG